MIIKIIKFNIKFLLEIRINSLVKFLIKFVNLLHKILHNLSFIVLKSPNTSLHTFYNLFLFFFMPPNVLEAITCLLK